ncbi:MAG: hypothetical protein ACLUOF_03490 [Ruminococcus sp.]
MNSDGNSYVLVHPKEDCILLWCKDVDVSAVQKVIHLDQNVMAPVKKGDKLGTIELKFSGEVIAEVPLVAVSDVDRSFTKFNAYALENFPNSPWFTVGIVAGAVLSARTLRCVSMPPIGQRKMSHRKIRFAGASRNGIPRPSAAELE